MLHSCGHYLQAVTTSSASARSSRMIIISNQGVRAAIMRQISKDTQNTKNQALAKLPGVLGSYTPQKSTATSAKMFIQGIPSAIFAAAWSVMKMERVFLEAK